MSWLLSWWFFGALVAVAALGVVLLFRSFRSWPQQPHGRDVTSQIAELHLRTFRDGHGM